MPVEGEKRPSAYRRFVDGYADIAAPLTRLCDPHAPWHWGPLEPQSFDALIVG